MYIAFNMEQFKDIKGFEGYYRISNHGRILSLHTRGTGIYSGPRFLDLKHRQVTLYRDGYKELLLISHLVWTHFVGPVPDGCIIDHKIEGDYTNNHIDNLQPITRKENSEKAAKLGRYKVCQNHGMTNISNEKALMVKEEHRKGVKRRFILDKYDITPHQYYNIIKRYWKNLT